MKPSTRQRIVSPENRKEERVPDLYVVQGRDSMNLVEFPLAVMADRVPEGLKSLTFEDEIKDRGSVVVRRLTISPSERYGLPTSMDDEVLLGLIQLSRRDKFRDRTVSFTRYELIQILGWRDEGKSYERIGESLERWAGVTLYYENAWWDKDEQSWVNETFHILDNVTLYGRERRDRQRQRGMDGRSSFSWNRVVFRSFRSGYLRKLDLNLYRRLEGAVAKRLFRFLDKHFYLRRHLEYDVRLLCCDKLGMSRSQSMGDLKRTLASGIRQLEANGIIRPYAFDERFQKMGPGRWQVRFDAASKRAGRTAESGYVAELTQRGVHEPIAQQLVRQGKEAVIERQLAVHDWLVERKDRRVSRSPAGFLVESIRSDYPTPPDFPKSQAGKQTRSKPKATRRAVETEIAPGEIAFDAHWFKLDDLERAAYEQEAIESATPFLQQKLADLREAGSPLADGVRRTILMRHFQP